ncbi:MAG: DNA repair protein RecO [Muribaculaceae bacterium]|nr:DNA repair protein RecO [Muribaculaceae bacterium]
MLTKIHGIVLSIIRHNDKNNIVNVYTAERGRVSFLSSASAGRSGRLRNARLAPLALIESEVNFRENRDLQYLGPISTPHPWQNIYFDPGKAPIVIFISEFLGKILRTSEADRPIWEFLINTLHNLDIAEKGLANFHLAFLIRFLTIAGISPDPSTMQSGNLFDMRSAEFTPLHPGHNDIIAPDEASIIPTLLRINYENMRHFRFNVGQRRRLLRQLIRYYSLHLPISTDLKSIDILAELYA